ncbi:NADH dehydrogenase [ubiquinone] 1 alpha subcomplex subunit 10, mitochondrial [Aethina tumida]|uniref:NADH dehydrogenase [ubiquinone] 1 alpha subcomplex subunit 10, mitochondrial n=1 Tax=Aethina tumida TaxID=116153 RepID=UPI00096B65E4|nr:NADH dehydrogenase [ubiquinone] 1 alpha subcomplex subunit 10, mitochondrial [Aethina tumida]
MASLFRIGVCRISGKHAAKTLFNGDKPVTLVRCISGKSVIREEVPKPAPYPYETKKYGYIRSLFDRTTSRFDENSKIIVVEGPVASGKSKFAKQLADELDMLYLPEANMDMWYINHYGYDLRKLDEQLPESCRSFDVQDFLRNPKHKHSARMQLDQYYIKFSQYVDALAHLLSTGQGVILDRCVYSDYVFTEAMYSQGYLSRAARTKYYEYRDNTLSELMRPHLVIYLDVPVPKVRQNIQNRAISYEKDSPVLTPQYLDVMEKKYKQDYLKSISSHSELLIYDWSEEGEVDVVIEDIERIDFDHYDEQDRKMKDWDLPKEEDWAAIRRRYADDKNLLLSYFNIPCFEVPELVVGPEDADTYYQVLFEAPGMKYERGYNSDLGDGSTLLRGSEPPRPTLPRTERRQAA